jgi:hypothetical protein
VNRLPGVVHVRVAGVVDEHFDSARLAPLVTCSDPIVIDLDAVERITSYGVREWLRALRPVKSAPIFFARVRPAMVSQFNSVAGFDMRGALLSLYSPYVCTACNNAFEVLTDVRKEKDSLASFLAPPASCPKCGSADASFDDLEAAYYACVASKPLPMVPTVVDALLDGTLKDTALPMRLHKDIDDQITALWLSGSLDGNVRFKRQADGLEGTVVLILGGVSSVDAAGLSRLDDLLDVDVARLLLARVPEEVARMLAARPSKALRAGVISVIARRVCDTCGEVDLDVTSLIRRGASAATACPTCGAGFDAARVGDLTALAELPFVDAPPEVETYLRAHAGAPGASPSEPDATPTNRIGRYEVARRIGAGGMAEVMLGRHVGLEGFEKKVVIKRILPHLAQQSGFVQLFLGEARVAARLTHPHVVQIYDLGREGSTYFIVMEYVEGEDFNALIKQSARLGEVVPPEIAARVLTGMCAGLHAAHTYRGDDGELRPILHRDVSPHNLLIGYNGAVKLTDFGVAKANDTLEETQNVLRGKVPYMAPEHIRGADPDPRMDIYSAGICLYTALVRTNPFLRASEVESLKAVLEAPVLPPSDLRADVPRELDAIVMRAIAREPGDRYQTALELQTDLEKFLARRTWSATFSDVGEWMRGVMARAAALPPPAAPTAVDDAMTTVTTPKPQQRKLAASGGVLNGDDEI